MDQLLIIITALIFYFLGRYTGRELEVTKKIVKEIKKKINPPHVGVIDYPTPQESEYHGSEEEKADQAREKLFKENFKPKI